MPGSQCFTKASLSFLTLVPWINKVWPREVRWSRKTGWTFSPFAWLLVFPSWFAYIDIIWHWSATAERLLGTLSSVLLDFQKGNGEWDFSSVRDILENWRSLCSRKDHYQCIVCVCVPCHTLGGQRVTGGSRFYPATMWVLDLKLRSSVLATVTLTHWVSVPLKFSFLFPFHFWSRHSKLSTIHPSNIFHPFTFPISHLI